MSTQSFKLWTQQPSSQNGAKVMAEKLAEVLDWDILSEESGSVIVGTADIPVHFNIIINSSNKIYFAVMNDEGVQSISSYTSNGANMELDILKTPGGAIAVGCHAGMEAPALSAVIAPTDSGQYIGIAAGSSGSALAVWGGKSNSLQINRDPFINSGYATAIYRMPDMISGSLVRDVYILYSGTTQSSRDLIYLNGKYYRPVIGSYVFLYMPED